MKPLSLPYPQLVAAAAAALAIALAAGPAAACAYFEGGWAMLRRESARTLPDGPIVVMLIGSQGTDGSGVPPVALDEFTVTLTEGEGSLPGSMRLEDTTRDNVKRLVFQPDAALSADASYSLSVTFEGAVGEFGAGGIAEATYPVEIVVPDDTGPIITQFDGYETKAGVDWICCDLADDACVTGGCGGANFCKACWSSGWTYPVAANLTWELAESPPEHFDFEVYRVDEAGGEELVSAGALEYQLAGQIVFAEDWSGDRCARVDAIHFETGEVLEGEVDCLEEVNTIERDPNPPAVPRNAEDCVTDPVDEDGNPAGKVPGDGCCSTASAPSRTPVLFPLLAVLLFWRRRP